MSLPAMQYHVHVTQEVKMLKSCGGRSMLAKQAGCDLRYSTNKRMSSVVSAGQSRAKCSKMAAVSPSRSPQTTES
eukprot:3479149-Amphidinium_carterae.2